MEQPTNALFMVTPIEQAIKDAICKLNRSYIAEIATYGGWLDVDVDEFKYVVQRFPAVWTTFEGTSNIQQIGRKYRETLTFVVLVAARSLRNEETARHGAYDANGQLIDVGTSQLLNDVRMALLGNDLGLKIDALELGKVQTVFNTYLNNEAVSVLAQYFHTTVTTRIPDPEADAAGYIERVNVDYVPKPNNNGIFAADTVELTEEET